MVKNHNKVKRFSSEEISVFCEQVAMLLNSGIPLYEGIHMLYSEMEDVKTKQVLEKLATSMKANETLYKSLKNTNAFPDYMVHMVQVGETTGKIEDVMKSLAEYYERESNVKQSLKSAIAYPSMLFAMMSVIIFVLVFKILPMFEDMFLELNHEVATTTKNMMRIGISAGIVIAGITSVALVVMFILLIWYRTKSGYITMKKLATRLHFTKKLSEAMATGKFISSMALMIASGIEMQKAMEIAYGAGDHKVVKDKIKKCKGMLERNISFEEAIRETKLLVGMESRLVTVAAKTGAQDVVFAKLSEQYNMRISNMLNKLSSTIETLLVVSLAALVGGVLISVMLPLVSMISSIS